MKADARLINKYNVPVPRYTSYPTVPFWDNHIGPAAWKALLQLSDAGQDGISLYIHLPFCESLCTYCGCNKKITTNHAVESPYIKAVLKEWSMVRALMPAPPVIREIHLGGGTPTFFSPAHLSQLIETILRDAVLHPQHELSIEGHPNNTTAGHLQTLYALGFRRISYGVQDLDPEVQRVINRIQPFENVQRATEQARQAGFTSVNFDLVYGLPRQNKEKLTQTILQCITLRPDRIAFYSYAHVPWVSRGQRLYDENDLPEAAQKLEMYSTGRSLFATYGYTDIGMDHFALPDDELHKAWREGRLHRNFMGYTSRRTKLLLGLGVSAISDAGGGYAQNSKTIAGYYEALQEDRLPVEKGYFLTAQDKVFRDHILDIACRSRTIFKPEYMPVIEQWVLPLLRSLENDGLVCLYADGVTVTARGRYFLRNICRAFDLKLSQQVLAGSKTPQFSKAL